MYIDPRRDSQKRLERFNEQREKEALRRIISESVSQQIHKELKAYEDKR